MNTLQQQRLQEVIKQLSQLRYVNAIILFGSQARGTARQDSDIDVAVLTQNATEEQEWKCMGDYGDSIEVSAFSRLPLIIQFRVFKEGKPLFVRNKKTFHEIQMKTIRDYLDFEPFIEEFYRRVINHV